MKNEGGGIFLVFWGAEATILGNGCSYLGGKMAQILRISKKSSIFAMHNA